MLLHGAGTGAWIWERVQQVLVTPSLALAVPGRVAGATPESCADAIVSEWERRGGGEVVAVLHSLAGVLGPALARRLGSRLRRCIFVAAVIPPSGGSLLDTLSLRHRLILRALFTVHRRGLKPPPGMIVTSMCNDLDAATAKAVVERYAAERPGLYFSRVGSLPSNLRSTYVKLLDDRSLPVSQQEAMISRLPSSDVRELRSGHLPMLSTPTALARLLDEDSSN
jgi:pimeloyl-ACP methyl ester carboxylesterase